MLICNGCHTIRQKAVSFNDVAIAYVKESAYRIHFWYMKKDDAINTMNNAALVEKMGISFIIIIIIIIIII